MTWAAPGQFIQGSGEPSRPDSNIDHRRVLNLMTYFDQTGQDSADQRRSR